MNKNYENKNGITILDLKKIINDWSELNSDKDCMFFTTQCEIWIENPNDIGKCSQLKSISMLNMRIDDVGNVYSDMLLSV